MHEWTHCHHQTANHLWPTTAAFWIMWIVSMEKFSNLTQNLMQICCSTCSVILNVMTTVHMLTQQHPPPPLTSIVKSSLFMYIHSSPLSLAARSHPCHTNHSPYIKNGWAFSGQTPYMRSITTVIIFLPWIWIFVFCYYETMYEQSTQKHLVPLY